MPSSDDALRAAHVETKRAAYALGHPLSPKIWRALLIRAIAAQNAAAVALQQHSTN